MKLSEIVGGQEVDYMSVWCAPVLAVFYIYILHIMFQLFCTIYYIIYILYHIVLFYILFTIGCFELLALASSTFDWWWTLGPKVRVRVLGKVNTYKWSHWSKV